MFEGIPSYPDASRFWQIIEKHKVNIFYTAPTAIRALMGAGPRLGRQVRRCSSLRLLGSVGEPINPEAWLWYHKHVGKGRCEIVDTWWQTETGGHADLAAAGRHRHQARLGDEAVASACSRSCCRPRASCRSRPRPKACSASRTAGRARCAPSMATTAVRFDLFRDLQGLLLHRRRLPARRGRLLLDHRPRRRRAQRLRPPPRHRRGRERAGGASEGLRGRRGRLSARHQGAGHLLLRHPDGGRDRQRCAEDRAAQLGAQGNRRRSPRPT